VTEQDSAARDPTAVARSGIPDTVDDFGSVHQDLNVV